MCIFKKKVTPVEIPLSSGELEAPAANAGAPDKPENKMKMAFSSKEENTAKKEEQIKKNIHYNKEQKGKG